MDIVRGPCKRALFFVWSAWYESRLVSYNTFLTTIATRMSFALKHLKRGVQHLKQLSARYIACDGTKHIAQLNSKRCAAGLKHLKLNAQQTPRSIFPAFQKFAGNLVF